MFGFFGKTCLRLFDLLIVWSFFFQLGQWLAGWMCFRQVEVSRFCVGFAGNLEHLVPLIRFSCSHGLGERLVRS